MGMLKVRTTTLAAFSLGSAGRIGGLGPSVLMAQPAQLLTAGLGRMAAAGIMKTGSPMLALKAVLSMNEARRTGGAGVAPANSPLSAKYRELFKLFSQPIKKVENFTFVCKI